MQHSNNINDNSNLFGKNQRTIIQTIVILKTTDLFKYINNIIIFIRANAKWNS